MFGLRIAFAATLFSSMLVARGGFATDLGPASAGFDSGGFTLRATLKGTSSQYRMLRDDRPDDEPYRASFATGGAEGALGFQDRVRFVANIGIGGFNSYSQPVGAPDGTYKTYGGGVRVTLLRLKAAPLEIGGGLSVSWWERNGIVAAGEWTALAGGAWRIVPGQVVYAGAQYYTVGGTQRVPAQVGTDEVLLHAQAPALYGGYEMRLAIFSARAEIRAEAPVFHRTGVGLSLGMEF